MKYTVKENGVDNWADPIEASCSEDAMQKAILETGRMCPKDYQDDWEPGQCLPEIDIEVVNIDDEADDPTGPTLCRTGIRVGHEFW